MMHEEFVVKRPVSSMTDKELMQELTRDAIAQRPTPLDRFIEAVGRIAYLQRMEPEDVFQRIVAIKKARTGNSHLPIG